MLGLDVALERQSCTRLYASAHWLLGVPPSGLAGGQAFTPPRWPRRPVWRVWDTDRGGLDPASSNGSVQGGLSGGTFELHVNGSEYHKSMASDHVGSETGS